MKNFSKIFGISSILYLLILVIHTLWALFQVSRTETSFTTTVLGITIDNQLTSSEISTTFGLTLRTLVIYLVFLAIALLIQRKHDR